MYVKIKFFFMTNENAQGKTYYFYMTSSTQTKSNYTCTCINHALFTELEWGPIQPISDLVLSDFLHGPCRGMNCFCLILRERDIIVCSHKIFCSHAHWANNVETLHQHYWFNVMTLTRINDQNSSNGRFSG